MELTQAVHRASALMPNAEATRFGQRMYTWQETRRRVSLFASALRELSVVVGDRVAVIALNSDRYVELYYAVLWCGGVLVPMNTRWSPAEHVFSIKDCGAKVVIVDDTYIAVGEVIRQQCEHVEHLVYAGDGTAPKGFIGYEDQLQDCETEADQRRGRDDLAAIYYTGGTTGFPKGVMLSHQNLWSSALATGISIGLSDAVRYLHAAPLFHVADGALTYAVTIFGGTHIVMPAFEPASVLELIERHRVTHTFLVPTMIRSLLDCADLKKRDLSSLALIMYGGAPMADALLRAAMEGLSGVAFLQGYGQTELAPTATILEPDRHVLDGPKAGKLRSAGRAALCAEVEVVDSEANVVPCGTVGQIRVRGPNAMLGYWNRPVETAAALVDGWVLTGDVGYMDGEDFLYVVDRMKDMIVSGGENVFSAEVENALMQHAAVQECAVIGVPDERWGERVHAVVVIRAGHHASADDLIRHCRSLIAAYKCPRGVELRDEPLPKSAAGKVLKADIRRPFWLDKDRSVN